MDPTTNHRHHVLLGRLLNPGGATGEIREIVGRPDLVAKIYRVDAESRREKLEAMLANRPQLPAHVHEGRPHVQLAWPETLAEDVRGKLVGFSMPLVHLDRAVVLDWLLARRTREHGSLPEAVPYRLSAAHNLSALVVALHQRGHHLIDLKPGNVHVYRDTMLVAMLDCDDYSIDGGQGRRFPASVATSEYLAPEAIGAQPAHLGEDQDCFALAVIIFQLINNGLHPFQGVPVQGDHVPQSIVERVQKRLYAYGDVPCTGQAPSPSSMHFAFLGETRRLFDRAFSSRGLRPRAAEWKEHLAPFVDPASGRLLRCKRDPAHFYFAGRPCGPCSLNRQTSPPKPKRPASGVVQRPAPALPPPLPPPVGKLSSMPRWLALVGGLAAVSWLATSLSTEAPVAVPTSERGHVGSTPPEPTVTRDGAKASPSPTRGAAEPAIRQELEGRVAKALSAGRLGNVRAEVLGSRVVLTGQVVSSWHSEEAGRLIEVTLRGVERETGHRFTLENRTTF